MNKTPLDFDLTRLLRKEILNTEFTRSAPDRPRTTSKLWLDKNENTDEEYHQFLQTLFASVPLNSLHVYPDCDNLYQQLAKTENVRAENLLLTAGSDSDQGRL